MYIMRKTCPLAQLYKGIPLVFRKSMLNFRTNHTSTFIPVGDDACVFGDTF
jgi:hypothetical protein